MLVQLSKIVLLLLVLTFPEPFVSETPVAEAPLIQQQDTRKCSPEELEAVALATRLEAAQLKGELRSKRIAQLKRESPQIRYVVVVRERQCSQTELKLSMLQTEYELQVLRNTLLKKQLDMVANELTDERKARAKEQAAAAHDFAQMRVQLAATNSVAAARGVELETVRRQLSATKKEAASGRGWKSAVKRVIGIKHKPKTAK